MKAEGVVIPEKVVCHEREVLQRPIMAGERVREELVPEDFEHEERTFDEGAVASEKFVVPQEFAREGGCSNQDGDEQKKERTQPIGAKGGRQSPCNRRHSEADVGSGG
jgi:general stress protein YciG